MPNHIPTFHENILTAALRSRGLTVIQQYNDNDKKTVDLAILDAKLFIEVDEPQHFTSTRQIFSDFNRMHYSDREDFKTFFVTDDTLDKYGEEVANAIEKVAKQRMEIVRESF
jgi:very-short-patch-repair endonuclease